MAIQLCRIADLVIRTVSNLKLAMHRSDLRLSENGWGDITLLTAAIK